MSISVCISGFILFLVIQISDESISSTSFANDTCLGNSRFCYISHLGNDSHESAMIRKRPSE